MIRPAADELPGWLVCKSRDLVGDDGEPTPDGARVVRKALADGKIEPADILSDEEIAIVAKMQRDDVGLIRWRIPARRSRGTRRV